MRKMMVGALAAAGVLGLSACSHADTAANTTEAGAGNDSGASSGDALGSGNAASAAGGDAIGGNSADTTALPADNAAANASDDDAPGNAL